eukprot:68773_1
MDEFIQQILNNEIMLFIAYSKSRYILENILFIRHVSNHTTSRTTQFIESTTINFLSDDAKYQINISYSASMAARSNKFDLINAIKEVKQYIFKEKKHYEQWKSSAAVPPPRTNQLKSFLRKHRIKFSSNSTKNVLLNKQKHLGRGCSGVMFAGGCCYGKKGSVCHVFCLFCRESFTAKLSVWRQKLVVKHPKSSRCIKSISRLNATAGASRAEVRALNSYFFGEGYICGVEDEAMSYAIVEVKDQKEKNSNPKRRSRKRKRDYDPMDVDPTDIDEPRRKRRRLL